MEFCSDTSDSETQSVDYTSDGNDTDTSSSEENEMIITCRFAPYQGEPLAEELQNNDVDEDESDMDGLTPETLAARQDDTIPVDAWCRCEHCRKDELEGALEHRCCKEVVQASGKMVFDGSIEYIKCITEHTDYIALSNKAVLLNVAPLLKNKDGRSYRRRGGVSENE
ncbi:uncharacterized protein LOC122948455 [Acropora millepora]|nr:uncharacterized protein LOC122948455 [Acropora millepora]